MPANIDSELNQWLEMLRSPNESDRLVAVKTLQHLGDENALALITALKDETVRRSAALTLGHLNPWRFMPI